DGLFPGLFRGGLHLKPVGPALAQHALLADERLNDQDDVAELKDVMHAELVVGPPEASAVEKGAVGAPQVADDPAGLAKGDLGMKPADGGVAKLHLHAAGASDAEKAVRLPKSILKLLINTEQTDARPGHKMSLSDEPLTVEPDLPS